MSDITFFAAPSLKVLFFVNFVENSSPASWVTYFKNGFLKIHLDPCQTSMMDFLAKTVNGFQPFEEVKRIKGSKLNVNK